MPTLLVVLLLLKLGIDLLKKEEEDFVIYDKEKSTKQSEYTADEQSSVHLQQTERTEKQQDFAKEQTEKEGKVVEPIFLEKRIEE